MEEEARAPAGCRGERGPRGWGGCFWRIRAGRCRLLHCKPGLCPARGAWGKGGIPAPPWETPRLNCPWSRRCEEPVSGQQPRRLPFPPAFRPGPGGPLGQVCPAPCPAAGTARLHAASPPCPPCPRGQPPPGPAGHTGVSLHLSGWPPPSLCCLPGWRSRTDPSRALPHCPSRSTCCPGQAVLCPLRWARLAKLHGYFFYFVP